MAPKAGDIVFLDTNILLSATDTSRQRHKQARNVFKAALATGFHCAISGQIIREYLVVATRGPQENGLGLSSENAVSNIETFSRRTALIEESEEVSEYLTELVRKHNLKGKRIHDANIAATMKTYSVRTLITENPEDFNNFNEISVINPELILE
jgi:predicted nucleic acid-binding protein